MSYNEWKKSIQGMTPTSNGQQGYSAWKQELQAAAAQEQAQKNAQKQQLSDLLESQRSARNRLNYVTNSKGETVIPKSDPFYSEDAERYKKASDTEQKVKMHTNAIADYLEKSVEEKKASGEKLTVSDYGKLIQAEKLKVEEENKVPFETPKNTSQAFLNWKSIQDDLTNQMEVGIRNSEDFWQYFNAGLNIDEKLVKDKVLYNKIHNSKGIYSNMNSLEISTYYYLLGKGDNAEIQEYIRKIKPELENRKAVEAAKDLEVDSDNIAVSTLAKNWNRDRDFGAAIASGFVGSLLNMGRGMINGSYVNGTMHNNEVLAYSLEPSYVEKLFQEVKNNSSDKGYVYNLLLDATNSTVAQVPQLAIGAAGGYGAYVLSMAAQSVGGSTTEAINQGYDGIRGVMHGLVDTAVELSVEKILGGVGAKITGSSTNPLLKKALSAIDNVFTNKTVAKIFSMGVSTVFSANAEGVEEFVQTLLEPIIKNVIYGESNKINGDTFSEAIRSYLIGAISGFAMDAGYSGASNNLAQTRAEIMGEELRNNAGIESVLKLAEAAENNSDTYYQVKGDYEAGRDVDNSLLAQLYQESADKFENPSFDTLKSIAAKNVDALIQVANQYTANKHNNAENLVLQSTTNAVSQPLDTYDAEKQGMIKSFLNSVDEKIKGFVAKVKSGDLTFKREKISDVNERTVNDIKNLLGVDVTGYTHNINTNGVQHILNRHGENGEQDSSMSADEDIARVGWVLENYDSVELLIKDGEQVYSSEFNDTENNPAPQIRFIKKIDGTYYVVEAACENNFNKLWVQSIYLTKNKEDVTQAAPAGNTDQDTNARSALPSPSSDTNVSQNEPDVNSSISDNGENYSDSPENDSSNNDSREPGFREADTKEIYRKSTEKDFDILTGKRKNAAQRQMEAVAEKFGVKVGYKEDITKGYYDPELKTIYMNPVWSLTEQYFVLFKHELTHHLENYKAYDSFKRYVVNYSNSFDAYVRDRLKDELGEEFKGSRKEALKAYNDIVLKQRQASKEIPDRIKKSYNPESIEREIVADFVGEVMLGGKDAAKAEAALMEIAKTEHRTVLEKIRDWVKEWFSIIKGEPQNRTLAEDLEYLNRRIARVLDSKEIKKSTTQSGVVKFDIAVLENGNTYVKASRNIIKGKTLSEQRNDITNFFKKLLKNKPSIDIHTIEGDILTLTMDETADKARDNYEVVKGQRIKMSEDEFAVKLRVESHIDEIVETSIKSNKPLSRDAKGHDFAKDGFEYRTAYFEDFDGKYYKIRFSIGHNGTVATVYNVGKIKEDVPSSAKLIAVVGSQALDGTSSNDIILNEEDSVKNNISREGEKYSSDNANSKHSVASEAFSKKLAELTEDVKNGKIGFDEFAKQVNDLAMNEHRIGEELMHALTEQEKLAKDFQEGAKRAEKLRDKIIMRQNKELMRSRRELKQEVESEREMYADRLTNLDCIRRSIKRIDSKLRANTNDKHVPEHLKLLANEVVSLFVANDTTPFKRSQLEKIKAFYDRGLNSKKADDAFIAAYDPEISENFEKLSELIEGKKLRDLDWLESTRVRTLVEHVEYLINSGNEMFVAGKKVETDEIGLSAIQRLLGQNTKVRIIGTQQIEAGIKYANMTPIYFFDRVGGVLKELFNDIVAGQDKWYRNVEMGKAYIRNIKEKYHYSEWKDKTIEFNTEDGESIELTVEQAMLLYATAQREYRDKTKQTNHLLEGGIVIDAQPLSIKAITTKLKDGKGKEAFLEEVNSRAHRITEGDVEKVFDLLNDEQIAYADALVEYLSNDMAALGNEVSMKLHGIRKYTSEYYIPYNSAANFLNMQMGVTNDARLKHQSFTKAVSEGAVTPLVLSNITEVCADHINRMSMYHALTIPLDAMERVLNYQIPAKENDGTESGTAGKSVASEITRIYGESAANYLKTFINDMNGTVRRSGDETIMNSMISKFKKGAVLASASVTIQQPSAVMRCMAYIDPKYFIKTTLKIAERDYQQLMQYAPGVAGIKAMGRFDTGTGVSTVKWMLQEEPKGLSQKAKAFVDLKDSTYRDDILSWTAAKADEITWAHIWAAVKAEVADKTTLKPGTEEFLEACGRRFTQVINYTQVYDSTLSRSQIMRNKSTAATMMTAFMSEPTVSLNLLMDAAYQAKKGTKASKKFAARAVGAFVGNVLLNAALKSLVTAARDDDEDETYLEKYLSAFTGNFTDDILLFNSIPYVKDIISSFKGYTVERADMSLFSDLAEAVRMLSNDNKTTLEKIEKFSGALAAFLGLPVKNVIRDMKAAWNVIDMAFISKPKGDLQGAIFAVTGTEGGARYEALAEAVEKGNDAEYQRIYKHLIDSGLSDEDIKANVQKFYRNDKDVVKQTKTYMKELAANKTYQGFDDESKKEIESNITSILAKEKTVEALAREPDRFDKLYEAKRKSKAQYEKLKKEMLDEGMSESLIKSGEEIAKVAYMKSIGIDIKEYYLFKMAMSEKYADTDSSGGVSSKEKQEAAKKLDMDAKAKQWLMKN